MASKARGLADLGNVYSDGALSHRNMIINGAMAVAQRGVSSTGDNYQCTDRWRNSNHASQTITKSQETLTSGEPHDAGFRKFLRMTQSVAGSSLTDYMQMSTRIEGLDIASSGWQYTSSSSYITASFWVRSSLAGEYQIYTQARGATNKYYFKKFNLVADTWKKVTCSMAGDPALTVNYDNDTGLEFRIIPYYGTDYTGDRSSEEGVWTDYNSNELDDFPQNWCNTSGATFDFTGVQLEVGDTATPFEHRSYGDELARCFRYYEQINAEVNYSFIGMGVGHSTTQVLTDVKYSKKRTAPSISGTGDFVCYDGTDRVVTSVAFGHITSTRCTGTFVSTGIVAGGAYKTQFHSSGDRNIKIDAEL